MHFCSTLSFIKKSACYFQCLEHFNNCSPLSLFTLCLSPIYPLLINFTHYIQQSAFRGVPHQQVISTLIQKADVNASDSAYLLIKLLNSKLYTLLYASQKLFVEWETKSKDLKCL